MFVLPPCKVEGGAPLQTSAYLLTYEHNSFCLSFYSRLTGDKNPADLDQIES